ncbi:MAG: hypothetical protein WD734_02985 [Dehalococcoidia bacterium]
MSRSTRGVPTRPRALAFAAVACLLAVALLAALTVPSVAVAQEAPDLDATLQFDPPDAAIGDRVTLTLVVEHSADVIVDAQPPDLEEVDLVSDSGPVSSPNADGSETTRFTWVLQPFLLGPLETGDVRVTWLRADGVDGAVEVTGAALAIEPTRAADDDVLRPLKPQATVGGAPPAWVRPALAVAAVGAASLLAIAIGLLIRRFRNREPQPSEVDVTPERIARDRLDALAEERHLARGNYEAYYGGIALAVRAYLRGRFGFNAHALTTTELEERMLAQGIDRWQARLVSGLLERCDGAVFARRYPEAESADHDLTVAYEIVELSRPRDEVPDEEAVAV